MPRQPPIPSSARQTLGAAFRQLESNISPKDWQLSETTNIGDVRKAALEIENRLAARGSLRNMRRLEPLLSGMEHYSMVMGTLCNGTPFLPWIWAPITLILRMASEYIEAFEKIMEGYSRIASSLKRFTLFTNTPAPNQLTSNPIFQESLAAFYSDIVQFHKHAYKFLKRNGWELLFLTSWGRFERRFNHIFNDLEYHGGIIDKVTSALHTIHTQSMLQDIRDWNEKNIKSLESLDAEETEQSRKNYEAIASWLEYRESEQREIIDSISDEAKKYPETCSWFIQHPTAKRWLKPNVDTPILCLRGTTGSGKSHICARTVDFLVASDKDVIYHFCSYSCASSLAYEKILRSLLMQLISRSRDIIKHVHDNYTNTIRSLRTTALENLLRDVFRMSSPEAGKQEYIWIVIDGLGECHDDTQARVTKLMSQITSRSMVSGGPVYKALISSQFTPPSLKHIKKENIIFLSDERLHMESSI